MAISIIVPIYNVELELDRCVQSILNQTYRDLEIILVDDGSPDNCPKMCDEYAKTDSRVRVIHKENGGQASARNAGLRLSTGNYIMYVDSDDYIEPDSCEHLLSAMQDDVDFVMGAFLEQYPDRSVFHGHTGKEPGVVYSARDFSILSIKKNEWYASPVISLYRRRFLVDNDLFFKEGIIFEDTHIQPKIFFSAKKIACTNYPFYHYMIRSSSTMQSGDLEVKANTITAIYNDWMTLFAQVDDKLYQRYLYGIMLRFYMRNCRTFKIRTWKIAGVGFWFAMKYALDYKERIKILAFTFLKEIYLKL